MKRLVGMLLLIAACSSCFGMIYLDPVPSDYDGIPPEGSYKWTLYDENTLYTVRKCVWTPRYWNDGSMDYTYSFVEVTGSYTIPSAVSGYIGTEYHSYTIKSIKGGADIQHFRD